MPKGFTSEVLISPAVAAAHAGVDVVAGRNGAGHFWTSRCRFRRCRIVHYTFKVTLPDRWASPYSKWFNESKCKRQVKFKSRIIFILTRDLAYLTRYEQLKICMNFV